MAKFRQNHQKSNPFSGLFVKVLIFGLILVVAFVYLYRMLQKISIDQPGQDKISTENFDPSLRTYIPGNSSGQLVHHKYYSLSYAEKHEQAEWVAYVLTEASLRIPNVSRTGRFYADYNVTTRSAFHRDYSGSGYTRGHLAPAGDMAFDSLAMRESFFMSNMSPQKRSFNNGIWKELEEQVRDWAFHNDELYIVTGPVLSEISHTIGKQNKVSVPKYFYKVILDINRPEQKGIGFVIPNELSRRPLEDYAVTIDSIEQLTGIDFYERLLDDKLEDKLESSIHISNWEFSDKRYQLRINKWNHQ